ncbi:MAG: hypothetical protein CG439_1724, partial [Methylococcaceae bacterium NSP1-2]
MRNISQIVHRLLAVYIIAMLIIIGIAIAKFVREEVKTSK